jgi:hypothetical protein
VPLAFITSTIYSVDQIGLRVYLDASLPISQFVANLIPAQGATIQILDNLGAVKLGTDNLAKTDVVLVTNGLYQSTYSVDFTTSVPNSGAAKLQVYPNPSNGVIHISGLEKDYSISIYNMEGKLMLQKTAQQMEETISLDLHQGVYLVKVITNDKRIITHQLIILK